MEKYSFNDLVIGKAYKIDKDTDGARMVLSRYFFVNPIDYGYIEKLKELENKTKELSIVFDYYGLNLYKFSDHLSFFNKFDNTKFEFKIRNVDDIYNVSILNDKKHIVFNLFNSINAKHIYCVSFILNYRRCISVFQQQFSIPGYLCCLHTFHYNFAYDSEGVNIKEIDDKNHVIYIKKEFKEKIDKYATNYSNYLTSIAEKIFYG
ncbi:MAG: hypothetical protein QXO21_00030 [Candidatus Anstonellales archaeon]